MPEMMKQWYVQGTNGAESLHLREVPIPVPGDYEVLVKFHAASLNYRDIMITTGTYVWSVRDGIVPGYLHPPLPTNPLTHQQPLTHLHPSSDAAGTIHTTGPKVTRFKPGTRVSPIFHLTHLYGPFHETNFSSSLGAKHDGIFQEYAIYNEQSCVEIPSHLTFREAATLPCAGVTAWNALYGGPRALKPGETVLTQGTGGVSIFAAQFAKIGGAEVISTTSSGEKAERLKGEIGADYVINYVEDEGWGGTAKGLSRRGRGADFVVEIGGAKTMGESVKAVAIDGQIAVIGRRAGNGFSGDGEGSHTTSVSTIRRVLVGSRQLHEEMNLAIEVNGLRPVVDERVFGLGELKEAFRYFETGRHFGKVVVDFE
ncbi:GroES-like protein [Aspergillus sclerotioniger CBS 115572]|uniref:GroES-like protein n=1 Tax=Aspergillus sclerotioniger CBS 115572 TaxID=1450535 RepID=A0A317VQZ2_9EURO|nr:GroES-like protein [Aspergillus sclerotioniger CBS 115572]PWY75312.1 GroES-like protein [Aspergillus sclerotioniger CBS 115572]